MTTGLQWCLQWFLWNETNNVTYRRDHDGIVKETESNEGDGVVEQNCRQAG